MISEKGNSGWAIALAWPETSCKQAGAWYDRIMEFVGFNKQKYYKAGHAALVLIDRINQTCHYFDFGRYHAPARHGRVRSAHTDPDLTISTTPVFSSVGKLINTQEILTELAFRKACHGNGSLHASEIAVDFNTAFTKAKSMQDKVHIAYGPFVYNGTNCSRFVRTVLLSGIYNPIIKHLLRVPYTVTPSPMTNVKALGTVYIKAVPSSVCSLPRYIHGTLPAPKRPPNIPIDSQWISGEGSGSWCAITHNGCLFKISRYDEVGDLEFSANYKLSKSDSFFCDQSYVFTHECYYKKFVIAQNGMFKIFTRHDF